ncbi:uncharacterized protein LOC124158477 isoform X2 [Ischnura elegans]|uniref:uncharacterized protein LOC124158477 isoform X2 n=1 Tax=Ischnura elegans TaxID=197161 RepID=UPI001ED894C2|nr:uncharacterized protein LOC124158477 isoform X2 [Ischnura elegans]
MKKLVMENASMDDLENARQALKILFMDAKLWNNGYSEVALEGNIKRRSSQKKSSVLQRKMSASYKEEEAAKIIQRFFKAFLERRLFLILRNDKQLILRNLEYLNDLLKSKNDIKILRTMVNEEPKLKETYGIIQDLGNEINEYEWRGVTFDISKDSWIPLLRYVFKWNSDQEIMSLVFLTCPLDHWILTITDNDTGQEVQIINNTCIPYPYKNNEKGYTVFAYGLDDMQSWSSVPWRVNQVAPKSSPPLLICLNDFWIPDAEKLPRLRADTLCGYYIPSLQKRICSFLMKVRESCQISLCFNTSDREVVFQFMLLDDNMETIIDQEKEGFLVIPTIFLDGPEDEEYRVYSGEATLVSNWQLSDFQKSFAENQFIKDVSSSQENTVEQSLPHNGSQAKMQRQSLMEARHTMGELFGEPRISSDSIPATWALEVLLNSPQTVVLEENKEDDDQLKSSKKELEGFDPGFMQKNAQLFSNFQKNGITECLEYSKKIPTKFQGELPYFEEFHEKDSDDGASGDMTSTRVSSARDHRASSTQKKSFRLKEKRKDSEGVNEENSTMRSQTTNASASEKGDPTDGETDFLDNLSEISAPSSSRKAETNLLPDNLTGHSCNITMDDIAGYPEVFEDNRKSTYMYFSPTSSKKRGEGFELKRKSTDATLYDAAFENKAEHIKEEATHRKDSVISKTGEIVQRVSTSSGHRRDSSNTETLAAGDTTAKRTSTLMETGKIIPKRVSTSKGHQQEFSNADTRATRETLRERTNILSRITKESSTGEPLNKEATDVVEDLPGGEDEVDEDGRYKRYYIKNYDSASSSTTSEELSEESFGRQKMMTIDDWVEIQRKTTLKHKRFKKKLHKLFTDIDALVTAPFNHHLEKWNIYMANARRSSSEALSSTEQPLDAYRRAKKKLEIARKEKVKEDMKIIRTLKGGKSKRTKDEKKPTKEKKEKAMKDQAKKAKRRP